MALVLNELIINAVKHGRPGDGVDVRLRKGDQLDHVQVRISNAGHWPSPVAGNDPTRSGLKLVDAMLPNTGAQLTREQGDGMVHVCLLLTPPVVSLERPNPTSA
jgi:two-component sensor histidine kinase